MDRESTAKPPTRTIDTVATWLGMALLHAAVPTGYAGRRYAAELLGQWDQVLFALGIYNIASATACILLYRHSMRSPHVPAGLSNIPCCLYTVACMAACYALQLTWHQDWIVYLGFYCIGLFSGPLRVAWTVHLLTICQKYGIARCASTLVASVFAAWSAKPLFELVLAPLQIPHNPIAYACALVLGSLACHACLDATRRRGLTSEASEPAASNRHYQLAPHAVALLSCFGVFQGVTVGMSPLLGTHGRLEAAGWILPMNVLLLAGCAVLLAWWLGNRGAHRYGSLIRYSVVVAGGALASTPLLATYAPSAVSFLSPVTLSMVSVAMSLFSICICRELGYRPDSVVAANIGVYATASGIACFVGIPLSHAPVPSTALQAFALLAVFAALATIPTLPSNISKASVFTLDKYPENETPQERLDRTCEAFAAKHGLTPREKEVLLLALGGSAHKEIAQQLNISRYTARDHLGSIYKKTQTHSIKELADLVDSTA